MSSPRQLAFDLGKSVVGQALRLPDSKSPVTGIGDPGPRTKFLITGVTDPGYSNTALSGHARELLLTHGARRIANEIRVEWNPRLKSCAGRADYRKKLITLNPELVNHQGEAERTLLHELAHFLAQFRAGKRRVRPHGPEWRKACRDLGIGDEKRCHALAFATITHRRRFLYRCPKCWRDFPRVRQIRRAIACLACCRAHSRGKFDPRFQLKPVDRPLRGRC